MSATRLGWLSLSSLTLAAGLSLGQSPDTFRDRTAAILLKTSTPGAAVIVVDRDRVVFAEGFGVASVETGAAVTPDTLFQVGSLTKLFTAAAVLAAADKGRLALDQPVGRYVTGLHPCLARVTLHQLLSHTAGLIDEPDEYGPHDERALGDYARSWTDAYCMLPPGRAFSYSNSGYALAGLALQEALGRPYADLMTELVFTPLGMTHTTFRPTEAMTHPLAVGHRVRDGRAEVVRPMADDARLWPAGEMFTSASDLSRFAIAFLNGGAIEGRQALPRAVIENLLARHADVPTLEARYGYGVMLDTYRGFSRVGHGGTMPGFGAYLAAVPEKRVAALVIANRDNAVLDEIVEAAFDRWALGGAAANRPMDAVPAPLPIASSDVNRIAGTFANPRRWTLEIARQDDGLVLRQFGGEWPMTKIGDGIFLAKPPGAAEPQRVIVGIGPDGRAEYVQFAVWAFARVRR